MRSRLSLSISVLVILLASTAIAQTFRGGIPGNVTDSTGAAIPGATVEIVNEGTGLTRSQPTTSNGDFTFSDLPVGLYTVTVSNPGFQSYKHEKVEVAVGRVTNLPITLGLARQSETIEVVAAAATLETTSSTLNKRLTTASPAPSAQFSAFVVYFSTSFVPIISVTMCGLYVLMAFAVSDVIPWRPPPSSIV